MLINGLPRNIDNLGRLTIPMPWRKSINLESQVEVFRLFDGIFIRPIATDHRIPCKFCENKFEEKDLKKIDDRYLCPDCLSKMLVTSQA